MMLSIFFAASLSAGNAEFDRAAVHGAMDIALRREVKRLEVCGPKAGDLAKRMLADPKSYDTEVKAKSKARDDFKELLAGEYSASVAALAERLGVKAEEFSSLSPDGFGADEAMFERCYAEERQQACTIQAKSIAAKIKPSEADFGVKTEEAIRNDLVNAVLAQQRTVVFAENRKFISENIVEPVLDSARKELARQRELLNRVHCAAYAPSVLEKELAAKLKNDVAEHQAKIAGEGVMIWEVFPMVLNAGVKEAAARQALKVVASVIDEVEMSVNVENLRRTIAGDRRGHYKAEDSEKLFGKVFASELTSNALAKVIADAPVAEREEFRAFVLAHQHEASLGKAIDARVRQELLPQLREIRQAIARSDAERLWPTLMDGTWYPEASLGDEICARSDFAKVIRNWRQQPEFVELTPKGSEEGLLAETEKMASAKIARAFELTRSAINAQNAALDRVVPEVLGDAKDRKASWYRFTPDYAKVVDLLTEEVEDAWDEVREKVLWGDDKERPENAEEQHRELFPSVKKRIELLARTIMAELEKTEVESPPEEEIELITISVERKGDSLETKIERGGSTVFEKRCPAKSGDFRKVGSALTEKLIEVFTID